MVLAFDAGISHVSNFSSKTIINLFFFIDLWRSGILHGLGSRLPAMDEYCYYFQTLNNLHAFAVSLFLKGQQTQHQIAIVLQPRQVMLRAWLETGDDRQAGGGGAIGSMSAPLMGTVQKIPVSQLCWVPLGSQCLPWVSGSCQALVSHWESGPRIHPPLLFFHVYGVSAEGTCTVSFYISPNTNKIEIFWWTVCTVKPILCLRLSAFLIT